MIGIKLHLCRDLHSAENRVYELIKSELESGSFELLRDIISIVVEEKTSAEWMMRFLAEKEIPSFAHATQPLVHFQRKLFEFSEVLPPSDLTLRLVMYNILREHKKNIDFIPAWNLSGDLYNKWKNLSIRKIEPAQTDTFLPVLRDFTMEIKEIGYATAWEKIASNIKDSNIAKFHAVFGNWILFYLPTELGEEQFELIKALSTKIQVHIVLLTPPFCLLKSDPECNEINLKETLPSKHILNHIFDDFDLKKSEAFSQIKNAMAEGNRVSVQEETKEILKNTKIRFLTSPETYRESEFFGRRILKLCKENQENQSFKTQQICLAHAGGAENLTVQSATLRRMGLSVSINKGSSPNSASFYSAVLGLFNANMDGFSGQALSTIFLNPAFQPVWQPLLTPQDRYLWSGLISKLLIFSGMNDADLEMQNRIPTEFFTWQYGFKKLSLHLSGLEEIPDLEFSRQEKISVLNFQEAILSLWNDLSVIREWKDSGTKLLEFIDVIVNTYLTVPENASDDDSLANPSDRMARSNFFRASSKLQTSLKEAKNLTEREFQYSSEEWVHILTEEFNQLESTDLGLLRKGAVITNLGSLQDIPFRFQFISGLSRREFPKLFQGYGYSDEQYKDIVSSETRDMELRSRLDLYQCLYKNSDEIIFSYINHDTVRDNPLEPCSDFLKLQKLFDPEKINYHEMPVTFFQENNTTYFDLISLEKDAYEVLNYKKQEEEIEGLSAITPIFINSEKDTLKLQKAINSLNTSEISRMNLLHKFLIRDSLPIPEAGLAKPLISLYSIGAYLSCPRKYFYSKVIRAEEEAEVQEEEDDFPKYKLIDFLRKAARLEIENQTGFTEGTIEKTEKIIRSKIFTESYLESFKFPFTLVRSVQESKLLGYYFNFRKKFSAYYKPNSLFLDVPFVDPNNENRVSPFPTAPQILDTSIVGSIDLLIRSGNEIVFAVFTESGKPNTTALFKIILTACLYCILEKGGDVTGISFGWYQINLQKNNLKSFPISQPDLLQFMQETFESIIKSMKEGRYPACPSGNQNSGQFGTCGNCKFRQICHSGRRDEFDPDAKPNFLELEDRLKKYTSQ